MKEQLVSFNTAVLAREKGFKEFVDECYDPECLEVSHVYHWHVEKGCSTENRMNRLVEAPTQGLLQKWLREKYTIDVVAIPVRFTGYLEIGYYTYMVTGTQPMKNYRFTTYEEALEIALVEGLNLI